MKDVHEVIMACNVVTGEITTQDDGWDGDDPRWAFLTDASGGYANGVTVEPWGEDEYGMERATAACRDIGLIVGAWRDEDGHAEPGSSEVYYATVTGVNWD